MKKMILAAFVGTFLASAPAHALLLINSDLNGNTLVGSDLSGPLSLDLEFNSNSFSKFTFEVEAADVGPIAFNSVIDNLIGDVITGLTIALDGTSFVSAGTVSPAFGTLQSAKLSNANSRFRATFAPGEGFGITLGNVNSVGNDFLINLPAAGERFSLTITTPEPATLGLFGLGLVGLASLRRRALPGA
jgi:PEP-CTERM motif